MKFQLTLNISLIFLFEEYHINNLVEIQYNCTMEEDSAGEGTLVKSLGENSLREIGHLVNVYFQVVKWTCTSWNLVSFGEKNIQLVKLPFNWWKRVSIGDH